MSDEGYSSPAPDTLSGPELEKALKECSNEKIQIPGFIQPNGVLFCVEKKSLRVLQVSANVEAVLGIPLNAIVSSSADPLFVAPTLPALLGLDAAQTATLTGSEVVDFTLSQRSPNSSPPLRNPHIIPPLTLETNSNSDSKTQAPPSPQEGPTKVRRKSGEFTAFCSHVPSPSMSLQLFGALSSSNYDEDIKMMTVEIEATGDPNERYKRSRLQQNSLQRLSRRLAQTSDILEACRVAAEEVRNVTGLDRVMVYEFDRDWHGDILFELTAAGIPQQYCGLRFPASDIPVQARRLYTVNPFRLISNTFYEPCPVVPAINPLTNSPLDMSHATFRSVSPVHIQYLKNIDVGCSMSISIIVNDLKLQEKKLFGLLVCHHETPMFLPYDVRETCMIIGQLMSLRVENLLHNKLEEKRIAMKEMVHSIATTHMSAPPTPVQPDLTITMEEPKKDLSVLIAAEAEWIATDTPYTPPHPLESLASGSSASPLEPDSYAVEVLRLFDADYGLIVVEGRRRILGNAAASEVVFLASFEEYVSLHNPTQILYANNLAKTIPKALPLADGYTTSGLLYIPLSLDASSYLALFRYEQVKHVKWAGAPQKKVGAHPVTSLPALMPRSSFHAWTEEVRGTSREWTELEIETAHSLFVNLMELMRFIKLRVRMVEETLARQKSEQEKIIAEASNKMKTQFLANLSHEVRTPLNAIIGMVDLTLATTKVDPTQANYLAAVQHASESLLLIINDLLDISKIEAGKLVLMSDTFELGKLVEQTVSAYKLSIERKGVAFNLDIDPAIPTIISTDSVRLCQVLTNLLSNAKKYTITGSITMKIYMVSELSEVPNRKASPRLLLQPDTPPSTPNRELEEDGAEEVEKVQKEAPKEGLVEREENAVKRAEKIFLHFAISDSGIGIPAEKLDSVFEPFEQVESQLTRKVGGTGLGLAICRRIVRLMGGFLWCESEFNEGSTFHFEIPVETGATRTTPDGSAITPRNGTDFLTPAHNGMFNRPAEPMDTPMGGSKEPEDVPKVLVVEDNLLNQKVAVNFLRRLNIASDIAGNGEIALNLYRENPDRYGAILMDVCMPVMDGLVASREIRTFEGISAGRSPRLQSASIALSSISSPAPPVNKRHSVSSSGNFRRVPIVALSAQVMDQDRDACMLAGMDGFLEKPVRFENLRKLLEPIYARYPKWQNPFPIA